MGFVLRMLLTGVAICVGLTVGDIVSEEIKDQYGEYKKKRGDKAPEAEVKVID